MLKNLLAARGVTPADLAKATGIPPSTISNVVASRRGISPTGASPTQPAGPTTAIAVIDVGSIFDNHAGLQGAMAKLRDEVVTKETALKAEQDHIEGLMEQFVGFKSRSDEYKKLEAEVAKAVGALSVKPQLQKKDFAERETKIYWQFYADIEKAVEEYVRANRTTAVLSDEKVAAAERLRLLGNYLAVAPHIHGRSVHPRDPASGSGRTSEGPADGRRESLRRLGNDPLPKS